MGTIDGTAVGLWQEARPLPATVAETVDAIVHRRLSQNILEEDKEFALKVTLALTALLRHIQSIWPLHKMDEMTMALHQSAALAKAPSEAGEMMLGSAWVIYQHWKEQLGPAEATKLELSAILFQVRTEKQHPV